MALAWIFAMGIVPFLFSGCVVDSALPTNMVPSTYDIKNRFNHSVSVHVLHGVEKEPNSSGAIAAEDFQEALKTALEKSEIFKEVTPIGKSVYLLQVKMMGLFPPSLKHIFMNAQFSAIWELKLANPDTVLWQDLIATTFTAYSRDFPYPPMRARIAIEGAGRENIKKGISELSRLNLN